MDELFDRLGVVPFHNLAVIGARKDVFLPVLELDLTLYRCP